MSNTMYGRGVEDIGVGMLRTDDGVTGIIESGYAYPSGVRAGDHFFRFVGRKASVFQQYGKNGEPLSEDVSHVERMEGIMGEGLSAIKDARTFEPNILDAVRILEIQAAVYDHARGSTMTNGPHPMGSPAPRP